MTLKADFESYIIAGYYRKTKEEAVPNVSNNNNNQTSPNTEGKGSKSEKKINKGVSVFESSRHPAERDDFEATGNETYVAGNKSRKNSNYV